MVATIRIKLCLLVTKNKIIVQYPKRQSARVTGIWGMKSKWASVDIYSQKGLLPYGMDHNHLKSSMNIATSYLFARPKLNTIHDP